MNSGEASVVIDFISKQCKENLHSECSGRWVGLGFEIICSCECKHNKNGRMLDRVEDQELTPTRVYSHYPCGRMLEEND